MKLPAPAPLARRLLRLLPSGWRAALDDWSSRRARRQMRRRRLAIQRAQP